MKAQLLQTEARSKRIKIKIPYEALEWRVEIKKIQGIWYHKQQKLWSVPNILANLDKSVFKFLSSENLYFMNLTSK